MVCFGVDLALTAKFAMKAEILQVDEVSSSKRSQRSRALTCAMRIATPSKFHVLLAAVPFSNSRLKA